MCIHEPSLPLDPGDVARCARFGPPRPRLAPVGDAFLRSPDVDRELILRRSLRPTPRAPPTSGRWRWLDRDLRAARSGGRALTDDLRDAPLPVSRVSKPTPRAEPTFRAIAARGASV